MFCFTGIPARSFLIIYVLVKFLSVKEYDLARDFVPRNLWTKAFVKKNVRRI